MLTQTFTIIRKNFSYLLAAETLIRLMMLVMTILLARTYGTEKFGIYTLALSIGNLFEVIFNLGLGTVFMQRVAKEKDSLSKELGVFLPLRIILSVISFICFTIFALLLHKDAETFIALILAGFYFSLFSVFSFLWSCFDSRQKMHFTATTKLVNYFFIFTLGMYFIYLRLPVYFLLVAYIAGTLIAAALTIYLIVKFFSRLEIKINLPDWRRIIAEGWPITLSGAFVFIYNSFDTIIISVMKGEQAVGLYQMSYKIIGTLFILSTLINQAYFPPLIEHGIADRQKLKEIFNKSIGSVFFWSIPITFGALMLAERIVLFVFGPDYLPGVNAFKILIWNCIIFFLSSAMTNLIYALKKQKSAMKIFFFGAAANTAFNIFMIPVFGIEGAALTTVLAEFVVLIGIYLLARKIIPIEIISNLWRPLIAGLVMAGSLSVISTDSLFIVIAIGALIYFGVYFFLSKVFPQTPLKFQTATAKTTSSSLPEEIP
jgi:O-antigen/teichoic acid export membrane protein